ncbi:MAG: ABC transporter substrate-binding protein [Candidatus Didemnitutus sp.]|nr:ABC transporter substrate-binding protein [Candidatus Didemnitutus sp.]
MKTTHARAAGISVRLLVGLGCALIAIAILFAVLKRTEPKDAYSDISKPVVLTKVRVGYIPIAECAHLYVGITKKYFEQEGLEVVLEPMSGGAVILPAVQSGSLEIGFANVASLVILNSKRPRRHPDSLVSLAGASYERSGFTNHALLSRRGAAVSLEKIAKGEAKVALNTTRNIEEIMLRRFLEKKGMPSNRLTIMPMAFPDMVSALERGDVEVISEVEPFIEPTLRAGRTQLIARQYLEVSKETPVATYAVTRAWLARNHEVSQRFQRAFARADEFIRKNDAETRQIIGSYTRILKSDLPVIGMPAFEPSLSEHSLRELIREMAHLGFIEQESSPADILDRDS